jgi:hypothetical protein
VVDDLLLLRQGVIPGPGSVPLIPKKVFDGVGGFDPDRRLAPSEDYDFYVRIAERYRIGFVPEVLVRYRQHGANAHRVVPRMERAMFLVFDKVFGGPSSRHAPLRRRAYGNLCMILAGSYFACGRPVDCARNLLSSLRYTPSNISRVLGYPVRVGHRIMGRCRR